MYDSFSKQSESVLIGIGQKWRLTRNYKRHTLSPIIVNRKSNATRKALNSGLCSMTPPTLCPSLADFCAKKHDGPDPNDLPYNTICSGCNLLTSAKHNEIEKKKKGIIE